MIGSDWQWAENEPTSAKYPRPIQENLYKVRKYNLLYLHINTFQQVGSSKSMVKLAISSSYGVPMYWQLSLDHFDTEENFKLFQLSGLFFPMEIKIMTSLESGVTLKICASCMKVSIRHDSKKRELLSQYLCLTSVPAPLQISQFAFGFIHLGQWFIITYNKYYHTTTW